MPPQYRLSMFDKVIVNHKMLDQIDGIIDNYEAEKHIYPSKYEFRTFIVGRICKALEQHGICSICGNRASSLAKKLTLYVKREGLFGRIAMVTVPKNPNPKEIKTDIINRLRQQMIDHCLLILDGFWWELSEEDFEEIGIPSPSENFKIVFTSRNVDMCEKIGSRGIFHVIFLEDEEAWDLFREIAGESVVDFETARKIVYQCDGFHIAILLIASALKDKPPNAWKDSFIKLETKRQKKEVKDKVFSLIHLSYVLLNDREAQLLFSLCCLFPKDFNIPVEDLVLFGKGLQVFENVVSMRQTRDRVECIIHKLKKSSFLLDGDEDDFVKLHYMCHDFGVYMSSKSKYPCIVRFENGMKEWPLERTKFDSCRAISFMCKTMEQHPVDLNCPKLHLLQCSFGSDSARLPLGLFKGTRNLKVLSLSIPSLLQSLTGLEKLRTLCITETISDNRYKKPRPRIGDLLGEGMKDLEIFSFSTARPYDDFPKEIGFLRNLRFLRLNRERLKYIPPGVLSKLVKLEELYLPLDFINWGLKEERGERMNASLSEIESLQLTAVRIGVPEGSVLTENLVKNLTRFHVFIGSHVGPEYEFLTGGNSKKVLEVFDVDADDFRVSWISSLVWKCEILRLKQVRNLMNIITREQKEDENIDFPQWKKLCISDCNELEYLAEGRIPWTSFSHLESLKLFGLCNLKEIWHEFNLSKIEGSCFGNLCEIQILYCKKLKYVFWLSLATELRHLQKLQICFCDEMEQIFYRQQTENESKIQLRGSKSKPTMCTGIHHKSKLVPRTSNSITKRLFGRGKQPKIVARQNQVEENIGKEEEQDLAKDEVIFPRLKTMELAYLDKLRIFYDGNQHAIMLPSLESLSIFCCNCLEAFCCGLIKTPSLNQIHIDGNQYSVTQDLNGVVKNLNCWRMDQAT